MAGLYTSIAKKRAEQNKQSMDAVGQMQPPSPPTLATEHSQPEAEKPPVSPFALRQPDLKPHAPKKQISAFLTLSQYTIFKQLYHKLNSTDASVDKGEIVGLSLEVLSVLLLGEVPNFPTLVRLREYLLTKVAKT